MQGLTEPDPDEAAPARAVHALAQRARARPLVRDREHVLRAQRRSSGSAGSTRRRSPRPGGEDTDLAWRAIGDGVPTAFSDEARVWHAVHELGALQRLRFATRWDETMAVFGRYPELRRQTLIRGLFWKESHYHLARTLAGLLLPGRLRLIGAYFALRYALLLWRRAHWHGDGKGGGPLLVPYYLAENAIELATAVARRRALQDAGAVIAVITTVRDGERALGGLADALDAQTLRSFEWVVIDNASRDRTADVARARGATVVSEPRPGRARARNAASRRRTRALLAFTDADCRPAARLARAPRRAARARRAARRRARRRHDDRRAQRDRALRGAVALPRRPAARLGADREPRHAPRGVRRDRRLRRRLPPHRRGRRPVPARGRRRLPADALPARPSSSTPPRPSAARSCGARSSRPTRWTTCTAGTGCRPGRYWRNPGPLVRGDWALRRFGIDPAQLPAGQRRAVLRVARGEYAARIAGSLWAALTPSRSS